MIVTIQDSKGNVLDVSDSKTLIIQTNNGNGIGCSITNEVLAQLLCEHLAKQSAISVSIWDRKDAGSADIGFEESS